MDLEDLSRRLGRRGIAHLLVEGGAATHASFLEARLVDRVVVFVAPKILGGGVPWLAGAGPERIADAVQLRDVETRFFGADLMVVGTPVFPKVRRSRSR